MFPNILAGLAQSIANRDGVDTPNPSSNIPALSSGGIESRFGVGGTSFNYVARPKILARLTDKDFSLPGAYSFKQVIWNREDQRSFIDADYGIGLRGEWNTGNSGVAKERNGFAGMNVGEETGDIVQIELDDDNETWWFDHNLDSHGGTSHWEDNVINITTGPGTGTGTGTGSGESSGGTVFNIFQDATVIVTGLGQWFFNVPVTFLGNVIFASTYPVKLVTQVCPIWVDVPPNSILYSDSLGNWFALPIGTDGQVLTVQANGSLAWETP